MEPGDTSRAGKPATRSFSSADDGEPPSKRPKPRLSAHGKYTAVENALETALAQAIDMGFELKQTSSHLDVAKAELGAYQGRSEGGVVLVFIIFPHCRSCCFLLGALLCCAPPSPPPLDAVLPFRKPPVVRSGSGFLKENFARPLAGIVRGAGAGAAARSAP